MKENDTIEQMSEELIIKQRNKELMEMYSKALNMGFKTYNEAVDYVINQPCSRYWISPKRAIAVIRYMKNLNENNKARFMSMKTVRQEMFLLLFEMYNQKISEGDKRSMYKICSDLVVMPAPKFFLCHASTLKIIRKERRKRCR